MSAPETWNPQCEAVHPESGMRCQHLLPHTSPHITSEGSAWPVAPSRVTSAELLRGATSEELREAAAWLRNPGGWQGPPPGIARLLDWFSLAAAALSLIAEGRRDKIFMMAASLLEGEAILASRPGDDPDVDTAEHFYVDAAFMRALAGGSP